MHSVLPGPLLRRPGSLAHKLVPDDHGTTEQSVTEPPPCGCPLLLLLDSARQAFTKIILRDGIWRDQPAVCGPLLLTATAPPHRRGQPAAKRAKNEPCVSESGKLHTKNVRHVPTGVFPSTGKCGGDHCGIRTGPYRAWTQNVVKAYLERFSSAGGPQQELGLKILAAPIKYTRIAGPAEHRLQHEGHVALSTKFEVRPFCFKSAWFSRTEAILRNSLHSASETSHQSMWSRQVNLQLPRYTLGDGRHSPHSVGLSPLSLAM